MHLVFNIISTKATNAQYCSFKTYAYTEHTKFYLSLYHILMLLSTHIIISKKAREYGMYKQVQTKVSKKAPKP